MKPTADLISKLGTRESGEGTVKTGPSQSTADTSINTSGEKTDGNNRGNNLLNTSANKSETSASVQTSTETKQTSLASTETDSQGSANSNDSWTVENALREIKKLREENKAVRLKYADSIEKLKTESENKIVAKETELQDLVKAKEELEQIKSKEEDRKRDLSEKLTHREAVIADLKAKFDHEKKLAEEKIRQYQSQVEQYKAESEAQLEVYKQRLSKELDTIPEKYKDVAGYIVKGAGDPRDALVALNEAKLRGLFEDKTVVVSHNVPGAADGARSSKEKLDSAARAQQEKLSSMEKIKEGLKQVRSGEGNSAFRVR